MRGPPSERLLSHVRSAVAAGLLDDLSDGQLLERFAAQRDEAAFTALLRRHAAMVLAVCRRVLRDGHAAEDVVQATFLVLARKAGAIRKRDSVAAWLHGVALRLARRSAAARARTTRRDRPPPGAAPADPLAELSGRELMGILDEELAGLPERYRLPLVLCHLEGRPRDEAAAILGWSPGQVKGCLERGRERLRDRLVCRGVALSTAAAATLVCDSLLASSIPAARLADLARSAAAYAADPRSLRGVLAPDILSLTDGAVRAMQVKKWTLAGLGLAVALVGTVVGTIVGTGPQADAQVPLRPAPQDPPAADDRATVAAGQDAARASRRNLKALAVAVMNFEAANGRFPLSAIYSADGTTPLLSWRVGLLPFLGEEKLYREFKLNEPWDSAHNSKLIARMPAVYRVAGLQPKSGSTTYYQVFVGKGCLFEEPQPGAAHSGPPGGSPGMPGMTGGMPGAPPGGIAAPGAGNQNGGRAATRPAPGPGTPGGSAPAFVGPGGYPTAGVPGGMGVYGITPGSPFTSNGFRMTDVTDGLSYTLLIVEGETDVTWTKPEDIPYSAAGRVPRLGGLFRDVFHAAFADGAVVALDKRMPDKILRAAIVRNDNIPFDRDEYANPVLTTDPDELRRENRELEREITRATREIVELRQQLRWHGLGAQGPNPPSPVELLQAEQKHLRRQLERLREELKKLQGAEQKPTPNDETGAGKE